MMTRLQEFLDGERDFADAVSVGEYVVEVEVLPDGRIVDAASVWDAGDDLERRRTLNIEMKKRCRASVLGVQRSMLASLQVLREEE
jgi:hypothetical protein